MPSLDLVCLANSRKMGGRCVAGLTPSGQWVRPVSADPEGTLYRHHYVLSSGREASVLDVIRVPLGEHVPEPHQPENWRVENRQWDHLGVLSGDRALQFLGDHAEPGPEIFGNRLDRVSWDHLVEHPAPASLELVEPRDLRWHITTSMRGNRQTRALFSLAGADYDLPITDPLWEAALRGLPEGLHPMTAGGISEDQAVFLTISLGEPFQGSCFKLVAAIIVP